MWKRIVRRPEQAPLLELESRLPPESPIRIWQESAPAHEEDAGVSLLHALAQCHRSDWASHAVAYHHLRQMDLSPSARQFAAPVLEKAIRQLGDYGATPRYFRRVLLAEFLGWTTALLGFFRIWRPDFIVVACAASGVVTLFSCPFVVGGVALFDRSRARMVQRAAATAMIRAGDPTCIVALEQHMSHSSAIHREAVSALLAILPQVSAEWYGHLPNGASAALANMAASDHELLALSALEALANAGDGSAAHAVKCLLERTASERVRERAVTLLPILIDRAAHKMAESTLLRPSSYNATEHLVRPVYSSNSEVTNLLRASHADGPTSSER